jgi:hypothetical protein
MKTFLLEFRLNPGSKTKVVDLFELRGPNRAPGVSFRNAWIGTRTEQIFVLCESADEQLVEQACQAWSEFGQFQIHPVINHEQY